MKGAVVDVSVSSRSFSASSPRRSGGFAASSTSTAPVSPPPKVLALRRSSNTVHVARFGRARPGPPRASAVASSPLAQHLKRARQVPRIIEHGASATARHGECRARKRTKATFALRRSFGRARPPGPPLSRRRIIEHGASATTRHGGPPKIRAPTYHRPRIAATPTKYLPRSTSRRSTTVQHRTCDGQKPPRSLPADHPTFGAKATCPLRRTFGLARPPRTSAVASKRAQHVLHAARPNTVHGSPLRDHRTSSSRQNQGPPLLRRRRIRCIGNNSPR